MKKYTRTIFIGILVMNIAFYLESGEYPPNMTDIILSAILSEIMHINNSLQKP